MSFAPVDFSFVIGIQSGAARWRSYCGRSAFAWFARPASAPNCNAHAERFIRSIKTECLDRVVPLGERHLRQLVRDFVEHYHAERNHQGIGNELIEWPPGQPTVGPIRRRQRIGGVLSYYYRSVA
jgi:transposase InsO family protein